MIDEPQPADEPSPLSVQERVLIGNVLKVHDQTAADVMVPRVDIVALDVETPWPEAIEYIVEQGIRASRSTVKRSTM